MLSQVLLKELPIFVLWKTFKVRFFCLENDEVVVLFDQRRKVVRYINFKKLVKNCYVFFQYFKNNIIKSYF